MEITFYNVSIEKNIKIYDFIYKSRNFILYLNFFPWDVLFIIYKSRNFILYLIRESFRMEFISTKVEILYYI